MHLDMEMTMGLTISISMGEMNQSMPMDINMLYAMDVTYEPNVARADGPVLRRRKHEGRDLRGQGRRERDHVHL